jgi:uncharacterized membrane protein
MGIGLAGLVDGIVLHQVLQWHHMISATDDAPTTTVAGLEANTLADGLFHVAALVVGVMGVALALASWRGEGRRPRWRFALGWVLVGAGGFNLVEGLVDHHLLGLHHVRDDLGAPLSWDLGFLAVNVVVVALGSWLARRGSPAPYPVGPAPVNSRR